MTAITSPSKQRRANCRCCGHEVYVDREGLCAICDTELLNPLTPTLHQAERTLVDNLERCVRQMFEHTGWDEDVDDDARQAVLRVEAALEDLDAIRKVRSAVSASPEPKK